MPAKTTPRKRAEDRGAFQEVARQLCGAFRLNFSRTASFDENLTFLRAMLAALHQGLKTVIFVIDRLEAFARRPKQLLLYNLFDALQASNVQARPCSGLPPPLFAAHRRASGPAEHLPPAPRLSTATTSHRHPPLPAPPSQNIKIQTRACRRRCWA